MTTQDIVGTIDAHLQALAEEIGILEAARAARAALQLESARPANADTVVRAMRTGTLAPPQGSPARASRPKATRRPRAVAIDGAALRELLASGGEMATSAIAERTGASHDRVLALLRELEASGSVQRIGEKRGTRWRVFTDEDWIARRAAELAARSGHAA